MTQLRAVREWQEYEAAVKEKDLAKALRFLRDVQVVEEEKEESSELTRLETELGVYGWERNWEVLDTCLNADDMRLVGAAYSFLKDKGFLPTFGNYRNIGNTFFPNIVHIHIQLNLTGGHNVIIYYLFVEYSLLYWLVNVHVCMIYDVVSN